MSVENGNNNENRRIEIQSGKHLVKCKEIFLKTKVFDKDSL